MHNRRSTRVTAALLGAAVIGGCSPADPPAAPSQVSASTVTAQLVNVRLDVTGTGRGNIRFSSDRGVLIAHDVVLLGWYHQYTAPPGKPVVLEVFQRAPATASCATRINGRLTAAADGTSPSCVMKST